MDDKNRNHRKKMVAPIVIGILLIVYFLIYVLIVVWLIPSSIAKVVGGILFLGVSYVTVKVAMERIKEIRSGEEDDLSKY